MSPSRESSEERTRTRLQFPKFVDQTARLKTFDKWPKKLKKTPKKLSHAGFFYTGLGQQVTCFSCGKLWITSNAMKWRTRSDPWKEHALLSPMCEYVKMVKGSAFSESAWVEDYELWLKMYEARKGVKKRKTNRDEKQMEKSPAD